VVLEEPSLAGVDDWGPAVSADELTLVFGSFRDGGKGSSDLWMATRPDIESSFSQPLPIAELNTKDRENNPSLSADGLMICYESTLDDRAGQANLYIARRPDRQSSFAAPTELTEIFSGSWNADCDVVGAGLSIRFSGGRTSESNAGERDLWTATRQSLDSMFGEPEPVAGVNSPYSEVGPSLAVDGLELYFSSNRPGGLGGHDIYVARRKTTSDPFGPAVNLQQVNTANDDGNPTISRDGQRLYLNRDTEFLGSGGGAQLWVAERQCQR